MKNGNIEQKIIHFPYNFALQEYLISNQNLKLDQTIFEKSILWLTLGNSKTQNPLSVTGIVQSTFLSDASKAWNICPSIVKDCDSIWKAKKKIRNFDGKLPI